ncbi:MAG: shikimate kinase [Myxococcota bacterium]
MGSSERDRCVLLCGLMGSGKSRVGRALASRLGWDFLDTDETVERAAGMKISEIFAREGEPGFRRREREAILALPTERCVVALGGGAVVSAENRSALREKGTLVWLDASPETLVARMGESQKRPLLAGLDRQARVARLSELRAERLSAYSEAALRVVTDGFELAEAVTAVYDALAKRSAA